ncbi:MAG: AAA family ATPase [Patescibacteria group bacterium]
MYLQRLEIQGFKSFAKKTVFDFPKNSNFHEKAHSLTAVVGPNGSGKSNVSDAIRWVLGEQSLKLIRCKKADDVIFGGSEKRARQGFAEVVLTMNNEDGALPIDYSEVVLTRRVYRNGETEYLINQNKVRLFDLLMLLAKANFGQRSYSIVGQGMVDHIINISAFERKDFFDEATGVKQFQIKRDQAVNRLRKTRENLLETNKIIAELEPRLRLLTRQLKKLEQRKEIESALREEQKKYYSYNLKNLEKSRAEKAELLATRQALSDEWREKLNEIQFELGRLSREESRKDIFNNLQKEYNDFLGKKNEILKDLAMIKGKMSLEYLKAGKQNLSWLIDKKEETERRLSEITESLNNLVVKYKYQQNQKMEAESKLSSLINEQTVLSNNLKVAEEELLRLKSGNKENYGREAIRAVLKLRTKMSGIIGTVAEIGKTEEMYELCLGVSAGNKLLSVVVENESIAVRCINYLKENRLGTVTFLPMNKIKFNGQNGRGVLSLNGAIGYAVDLVNYDEKYKNIFDFVFGRTIVVDTIENAKAIGVGTERMVTLDGDLLEKSGAMRGGFQKKNNFWASIDDKGAVSYEEKIREITINRSRLESLEIAREKLSVEINNWRVDIQVAETKKKALENDGEVLQKESQKIALEINENKVEPKDYDRYLADLEKQKERLEKDLKNLEKELSAIRQNLDEFNLEEEKKKNQVFRLQDEMQNCQNKVNGVSGEVNELQIALAKIETKREDLEKEILTEFGQEDGGLIEEFLKVDTASVINIDSLWFEIGKLKNNLEQIGGIDPEIVDEHREVSERYEFLTGQVNDLDKGLVDLEKIVVELDEVINNQFTISFKKINEAFERYFTKIFNGGRARLELVQREKSATEEINEAVLNNLENPNLEAQEEKKQNENLVENKSVLVNTGIEIMVAPPNKKINNIAVLSGGERTMTSLALICAIIDSNPAPFVVMDEVEAALDESNSHKFSQILQELAYKSQFVIITHNRITMHVADVLYGVAMGDDGVSKTLSLNLEGAEKEATE